MDRFEISKLIDKHANYKYIFMNEEQLRNELKNWCRQDLISWLKWNDPNGIYDDSQSIQELGNIMTYQEGIETIVKQVIQK